MTTKGEHTMESGDCSKAKTSAGTVNQPIKKIKLLLFLQY
jgi:hypothetical protein